MRNLHRLFLVTAIGLASCLTAQADVVLPGKTLKGNSRAGLLQQPAKNPKNIVKGVTTQDCPHTNLTLTQLLVYARTSHPSLFRQAVKLRRTGFTQEATRQWLLNAVCDAEGTPVLP